MIRILVALFVQEMFRPRPTPAPSFIQAPRVDHAMLQAARDRFSTDLWHHMETTYGTSEALRKLAPR